MKTKEDIHMSEQKFKEVIAALSNEEIAEALTSQCILPDVKKLYKDEAVKRFVAIYNTKKR